MFLSSIWREGEDETSTMKEEIKYKELSGAETRGGKPDSAWVFSATVSASFPRSPEGTSVGSASALLCSEYGSPKGELTTAPTPCMASQWDHGNVQSQRTVGCFFLFFLKSAAAPSMSPGT